jgi:hypothetical protein
VQSDRHLVPVGREHATSQAIRWREADGVQDTVEAVPALGQGRAGPGQLLGRRDVDLEDIRFGGELARGPFGQRQGTPGTGEDDLGPFPLGQLGHGEGE